MGVIQRRDRDSNLSVVTPSLVAPSGALVVFRAVVFFVRAPPMEIVYDDPSKPTTTTTVSRGFPSRSDIRLVTLSFFMISFSNFGCFSLTSVFLVLRTKCLRYLGVCLISNDVYFRFISERETNVYV